MSQSMVSALALATALIQELQPLLTLSSQPCLSLSEQISTLTARFLSGSITPAATLDFENDLRLLLDSRFA